MADPTSPQVESGRDGPEPLALIYERDKAICSAILATMGRLGFVTPAEGWGTKVTDATNDLRQALQTGSDRAESHTALLAECAEVIANLKTFAVIKYGNLDPDANTAFAKADALVERIGRAG